jgi:hypothetical protein
MRDHSTHLQLSVDWAPTNAEAHARWRRGNLFDAILLCENHFEMLDLRLSDFGRIDRHIPIFPLRGRETKVIDFADARL